MYIEIKRIYPTIKDSEFQLQDNADGKGAFIAGWTFAQPQPTPAQIAAATTPSKDENNAPLIASLLDIDMKSIRALRESDLVRLKALNDQATLLRTQLK